MLVQKCRFIIRVALYHFNLLQRMTYLAIVVDAHIHDKMVILLVSVDMMEGHEGIRGICGGQNAACLSLYQQESCLLMQHTHSY